jgi:hypothetical protein
MNSWLEIEEFSTLVNLDISAIQALIEEGKLISKEEVRTADQTGSSRCRFNNAAGAQESQKQPEKNAG